MHYVRGNDYGLAGTINFLRERCTLECLAAGHAATFRSRCCACISCLLDSSFATYSDTTQVARTCASAW
ncbi:hypothetical protein EXIGLDRAFT_719770 [Exidia glandulosa HHB12029]|uniref:Uncharacterized protein n=1 Tax=Exidia glandulosa HHB12029 TaxID=1314781 RepID=A0A166MC71_EXIGL|nr:hypothetical protein EXIGLDRAFT_719770 [Exidia glandulosa HHB12029]